MPNKAPELIQAATEWLLVSLFAFPILPLPAENILFILFTFFVLISLIYKKPSRPLSNIKNNLILALPFIPYIFDFILHYNNAIVFFEAEKKLLFFICPVVLGLYTSIYSIKPLKVYMYCFTISLLVVTLYTITILLSQNILFSPSSYENEAFVLRRWFEEISHLHPTYYSLFAGVAILWIVSELQKLKGIHKWLFILAAIVLLFQVLFVAARMPLIGLAISLLFLFYKITANRKRLLTIYALLVPCIIAAPFIVPSLNKRVSQVRNFIVPAPEYPHAIDERKVIFDCGITVFTDNFWLGVGSANYQVILNQCYAEKQLKQAKVEPFNAHNQFLTIGINYGVFPFLLFLSIIAIYFKRTLSNPFATALMISGVMVMCTESILERQRGVYFFVLFFLLMIGLSRENSVGKNHFISKNSFLNKISS
jgi:hypothetical protein